MKKYIFQVEGMMCPMCEAHTNDAVRTVYPKAKVSSSHKDALTTVIGEDVDIAKVKEAIEKTGYKVGNVSEEPYEKKGILSSLFGKK